MDPKPVIARSSSLFARLPMLLFTALIIAMFFAGAVGYSSAAAISFDRYVSKTGSADSGDCISTPCLTIAYAMSKSTSGDRIHIGAGIYFENLNISVSNLVFMGAGMEQTFIDGGNTSSVIDSSYSLTMQDLTIRNGKNTIGGGISNYKTMILERVKITGNHGGDGAGIFTIGNMTLTDCVISDNHADPENSKGGGMYVNNGVITFTGGTIQNNTATGFGGGIYNQNGDSYVNLTNVTITGNVAANGGAIYNTANAHMVIKSSTIAGNHASGAIGGAVNSASFSFLNSIVSANDTTNCQPGTSGTWVSNGNNIDSGTSCRFTETSDQSSTDPLLGTLGDNGGPTETMALMIGSPAINTGTNTDCPTIDQRGITRPQGTTCDIGAFEFTTPSAFTKISPFHLAKNQKDDIKFVWNASSGQTTYEICIKVSGGTCTWMDVGDFTEVMRYNFAPGTYLWQVRAVNVIGSTAANSGSWWKFTHPPKPGAFNKTTPANNSTGKLTTLTLDWTASSNAAKYEYCIKKSMSALCTWKSTGTVHQVTISGLLKNTKYYWQVRAKNATGTTNANSGSWWSFTTKK